MARLWYGMTWWQWGIGTFFAISTALSNAGNLGTGEVAGGVAGAYLFTFLGVTAVRRARYRFTDATPPESSPLSREEPAEPRRDPDNDTATPKQLIGGLVALAVLTIVFTALIWFLV
jgi:hypothetical protein